MQSNYKHTTRESVIVDDLIGITHDAQNTFKQQAHHLHIELTCYSEIVKDYVEPGATSSHDLPLHCFCGLIYIENEQSQVIATPIEFKYDFEVVDGFIDYISSILIHPNIRLIYQVLPRFIVILDPIDGFPFRAEISSHELSLTEFISIQAQREHLESWIFELADLGRRISIYLTPDKYLLSNRGSVPKPSMYSRPSETTPSQSQSPTPTQPTTSTTAFESTKSEEHDQTTAQELARMQKLLDAVEQSVNDAKDTEIPTVPLHAGEGEVTETERKLIDAKNQAAMQALRDKNDSILRSMLENQVQMDHSVLPGMPPTSTFEANESSASNVSNTSNEEANDAETSATVNALFGTIEGEEEEKR